MNTVEQNLFLELSRRGVDFQLTYDLGNSAVGVACGIFLGLILGAVVKESCREYDFVKNANYDITKNLTVISGVLCGLIGGFIPLDSQ